MGGWLGGNDNIIRLEVTKRKKKRKKERKEERKEGRKKRKKEKKKEKKERKKERKRQCDRNILKFQISGTDPSLLQCPTQRVISPNSDTRGQRLYLHCALSTRCDYITWG